MRFSVLLSASHIGPGLPSAMEAVRVQMERLEGSSELLLVLGVGREDIDAVQRASLERYADRIHSANTGSMDQALVAAICAARGERIVLTEDRVLPEDRWLAELLLPLQEDDGPIHGVGGPIFPRYPGGGAPDWLRQLLQAQTSNPIGPFHVLPPQQDRYALETGREALPYGMNVCYRRDAIAGWQPAELPAADAGCGLRNGYDLQLAMHVLASGASICHARKAKVSAEIPPRQFALAYGKLVCAREALVRRSLAGSLAGTLAESPAGSSASGVLQPVPRKTLVSKFFRQAATPTYQDVIQTIEAVWSTREE